MSTRPRSPLFAVAVTALAFAFAVACATSMTGQQQLLLYPESQMAEMGSAAFTDLQSKTPRSSNSAK